MTLPMNSSLLSNIARQAGAGIVTQSEAQKATGTGTVSGEGNKHYGFAWIKNVVSSDARAANVALKKDFVAQLKTEFNLKEGHVEAIKNRLGRSDTPLDLEQAKSIISQLQNGDKFFMTPSENVVALKKTFASQLGFTPDANGKLRKDEDGALLRGTDFLTSGATTKAADRSSLSTHVDAYLDAMDQRRAEGRPGEVIPDRAKLKSNIQSEMRKIMTDDIRLAARDDLVKLSNNGTGRLTNEKVGTGPESAQMIAGRAVEDVIADRLVDKMKAKADQLQHVTTQSKTDELRLNRMERLFGIPVTQFDRQIAPTKSAPNALV